MCVQDWRIGRLIRTQITAHTLVVGTPFLIPANKQRVGLSLASGTPSGAPTVLIQVLHDGILYGMLWNSYIHHHITVSTHGDLPMKSAELRALVANAAIGVIEYFLPEEFLSAGLEEFKRENM